MEFDEKFKNYSNSELLRIIDNPNDYQPQAVETAKNIISDRQLSEVEIKIAKEELEFEIQEKSSKKQQKRAIENKVKDVGKYIFDHINPIQQETPTSEKTIRIISIFFSGLFLFHIYKKFRMLMFMFTNSYAEWDFSLLFYFLPLIIIPSIAILFYTRKKIGWLLLIIYLTYSAVLEIGKFILAIKITSSYIPLFDLIFPQISPLTHILAFLFFSGVIWIISKENIRTVYSIGKQTMILTVIVTALIAGLGITNTFI